MTEIFVTEIFVFGSNTKGFHGAGAALTAYRVHGAKRGVGEGLTGNAYAIPTKNDKLASRTLKEIQASVNTFKAFAASRPDLTFNVTRTGCGLAGYKPEQIAPMFKGAPDNVRFIDPSWEAYR